MTRLCKNCQFENQDDYDFCAKCGTPLVEGLKPAQIRVYRTEDLQVNKTALIFSYIATILFSWSGFIIGLFSKNTIFATQNKSKPRRLLTLAISRLLYRYF